MRKFQVDGINCQNCANTIINALKDEFGEIEVDLNVNPRVISLNLESSKLEKLKDELDDLGFDFIKEI